MVRESGWFHITGVYRPNFLLGRRMGGGQPGTLAPRPLARRATPPRVAPPRALASETRSHPPIDLSMNFFTRETCVELERARPAPRGDDGTGHTPTHSSVKQHSSQGACPTLHAHAGSYTVSPTHDGNAHNLTGAHPPGFSNMLHVCSMEAPLHNVLHTPCRLSNGAPAEPHASLERRASGELLRRDCVRPCSAMLATSSATKMSTLAGVTFLRRETESRDPSSSIWRAWRARAGQPAATGAGGRALPRDAMAWRGCERRASALTA